MADIMGFDEFIYVVKVVEDGEVMEYEFGNPKTAADFLASEPNGKLFKHNTITQEDIEC